MLLHHISEGPLEPQQVMCIYWDIKFNMAIQLSDEDDEKPLCLTNVGNLFYGLYAQSHNNTNLNTAIAAYEAAVRLMPDGHQCQAEFLSLLGISLC